MREGWVDVTLGAICESTSNIKWSEYDGDSLDYIDLTSVDRDSLTITETTKVTSDNAPSRARKIIHENDVIFATTRPTLGRVTTIGREYHNQICSTGYAVLRPMAGVVTTRFIYYFILSESFMRLMESLQRGASYPAVSEKDVKQSSLKIPKSIEEQKQIVAILDEAFAAIDQAQANIEKNIENAKELFQSKLNDIFSQTGEGWEEDRMVNVCSILTCGVASTPKYVDEAVGVPFLSAQNVRNGRVVLDKFRCISKEFHEHLTKKNKPRRGDILYSRVGAKFGEAGVVEHDFEFSVYVSVTLIRPLPEIINNYYLKYYLNSPIIKNLAKSSITSSGVPNLNVNTVRDFPVFYPSIEKQLNYIEEIQRLETIKLRLLEKFEQKLTNLEDLKKSLLEQAFAGELTPKDMPA